MHHFKTGDTVTFTEHSGEKAQGTITLIRDDSVRINTGTTKRDRKIADIQPACNASRARKVIEHVRSLIGTSTNVLTSLLRRLAWSHQEMPTPA